MNTPFTTRATSIALATFLMASAAQATETGATAQSTREAPRATSVPSLKLIADKEQTCNMEGRSVRGGTKWCRAGEWHECNGKNGEWVNTRQKCKQ